MPVAAPAPPPCEMAAPGEPMTMDGCKAGDVLVLRGVNFEFDRAALTPAAKLILDEVGAALTARPDIKVAISGHTDSLGTEDYNLSLSEARAKSVAEYLVGTGVAGTRLSSAGFGESMPVADNSAESGRAENRRVELKIVASGTPAPAPAPAAMPQAAGAADASPATVTIADYAYSPGTLTVAAGTRVTWSNADGSNHFVTFADQGSDRLAQGASYSRSFSQPGEYAYACSIHPSMTGKVIVQ